jgi:hypothetical protein
LVVGCEKKRSKAIPLNPRFAIFKGDSTTVIKFLTHPPSSTPSVLIIGTLLIANSQDAVTLPNQLVFARIHVVHQLDSRWILCIRRWQRRELVI